MGYTLTNLNNSTSWPASDLKVTQALALNEIVNAPAEFVSRSPHLVVAQLDWIQTRYLFVRTTNAEISVENIMTPTTTVKEPRPFDPIEQDINYTPMGSSGSIIIPKSAVARSRREKAHEPKNKRHKTAVGSASDPIEIDADDDDGASVATLEEDRVSTHRVNNVRLA